MNNGGGYINETLTEALTNGATVTIVTATATATGHLVAFDDSEIVLRDSENAVHTVARPFQRLSFDYGGNR